MRPPHFILLPVLILCFAAPSSADEPAAAELPLALELERVRDLEREFSRALYEEVDRLLAELLARHIERQIEWLAECYFDFDGPGRRASIPVSPAADAPASQL